MATESQEQVDELSPQITLTDVGKYSLAQLCVSLLCNFSEAPSDLTWSKTFISKLVEDVGLPVSLSSTFCLMLEQENQREDEGSLEPVVSALKAEKSLCEDISAVAFELIRLSLKQGGYDARARVLVYLVGHELGVSEEKLEGYEHNLADSMAVIVESRENNHDEATKRKLRRQKKKVLLIGLGVVTGGAIIGLTGGLAAPLVAASAGAIIGGSGATFLASSAGLALITSVFGATGAGLTGYKVNRRVGKTEEFEFIALTPVRRLHITICVSGWLLEDELHEFTSQWAALSSSLESYSLKWESKFLIELGSAIRDLVTSNIIGTAAKEALNYTVLKGLMAAITWPVTLLNAASVIDNPWSVCASRAKEVGRELARVLLSHQQGLRPVTVIGFSLGARVIYYCLEELSQHGDSGGIIEDAILLGAPVNGNEERWKKIASVVAGKVVNGFCRKDWLLRFIYRASSLTYKVAGLRPITWRNRRLVNIDLTEIIDGHLDYADPENLERIFEIIGVKTDRESKMKLGSKKVLADNSHQPNLETECLVHEILDEQVEIAMDIAISKETMKC